MTLISTFTLTISKSQLTRRTNLNSCDEKHLWKNSAICPPEVNMSKEDDRIWTMFATVEYSSRQVTTTPMDIWHAKSKGDLHLSVETTQVPFYPISLKKAQQEGWLKERFTFRGRASMEESSTEVQKDQRLVDGFGAETGESPLYSYLCRCDGWEQREHRRAATNNSAHRFQY